MAHGLHEHGHAGVADGIRIGLPERLGFDGVGHLVSSVVLILGDRIAG